MKLIIDIPEEMYEFTKSARKARTYNAEDYVDLILNGTPLEDVRAEIEELDRYYDNDYFSTNNCPMYKCNEVLQILDRIGKESEVSE